MKMYKKEERYELRYEVPTAGGNWSEKVAHYNSKEKAQANRAKAQELGYKVISLKKLYPFSTMKNQHNFELIHNICMNTMYDMDAGEIPYDNEEYNRLWDMKEKSEEFFCLPLPVAWLPWEKHQEAKKLANMAIMHRQDACIANGRPDLVTYC
jgi:hypothetical protein